MTLPETSIENLRSLGYTEDEARFLYIAATHSSYFSTRQYLQFTGAKSGERNMAFTQKLLGMDHATAKLLLRNGRVYHLCSRLIYRAIGRSKLRNRREHSLEYIRTKLAILDFVLAHLDYRYLETEAEKVDYFCSKLGISRAILPAKRYSGAIRHNTTDRYFVDKFPLFFVPESSSSPVITFSFIDPGLMTLASFETHLLATVPSLLRCRCFALCTSPRVPPALNPLGNCSLAFRKRLQTLIPESKSSAISRWASFGKPSSTAS